MGDGKQNPYLDGGLLCLIKVFLGIIVAVLHQVDVVFCYPVAVS